MGTLVGAGSVEVVTVDVTVLDIAVFGSASFCKMPIQMRATVATNVTIPAAEAAHGLLIVAK
jgi:hypothetical protein